MRHRAHVEVHDHQAAVAVAQIPRALGGNVGPYDSRHRRRWRQAAARAQRVDRRGLGRLFHGLELAEADGLRHAVFSDDEVLRCQALDILAALVLDRDCFDDQLRVGLKPGGSVGGHGRSGRGLLSQQATRQRQNKY